MLTMYTPGEDVTTQTVINALKTDASEEIVHFEQSTDNESWALLEARIVSTL